MEKFKEFRLICQPYAKINKDTIVGKILYRKFSIYLTIIFVYLKFSANIVSLLGMIVCLSGISLFALSSDVKLHFIGVILLQISIFMDYSDGEVARYRKHHTASGNGENNISGVYMDNIVHYILTPVGVFFFGYRAIHFFPDWSIALLVISFLTAICAQGIPNLVMSHIILNSMQENPKLMNNNKFRAIALHQINILLSEEYQLSLTKKAFFKLAKLYKSIDAFGVISLDILLELLLSWFGYLEIASYLGLSVLFFLFFLFMFNFSRTFRRDFLYLSTPF